jgi:hypothetical protein
MTGGGGRKSTTGVTGGGEGGRGDGGFAIFGSEGSPQFFLTNLDSSVGYRSLKPLLSARISGY